MKTCLNSLVKTQDKTPGHQAFFDFEYMWVSLFQLLLLSKGLSSGKCLSKYTVKKLSQKFYGIKLKTLLWLIFTISSFSKSKQKYRIIWLLIKIDILKVIIKISRNKKNVYVKDQKTNVKATANFGIQFWQTQDTDFVLIPTKLTKSFSQFENWKNLKLTDI